MAHHDYESRFSLITLPASSEIVDFAKDVAAGLSATPKRLPCRHFYDHEGSILFDQICRLPEYYLTGTESRILEEYAAEIVQSVGAPLEVVELGSGTAMKTRLLLEAAMARQERVRFIPIDISGAVLHDSSIELLKGYAALDIVAFAGEYDEALRQLRHEAHTGARLVLWLGSSIGNLHRPNAAAFLGRVRETLGENDRLLIGIDLRKDRAVLEPAYNDAQGVTARFNRNILSRINRELDGDFKPEQFRHEAPYDQTEGRIEMYLVSACAQTVSIDHLNASFEFEAGERIHTENSHKYSQAEINALARDAGFRTEKQWLDSRRWFSVNLFATAS